MTNINPATIAGLIIGKTNLNIIPKLLRPRVLPTSKIDRD